MSDPELNIISLSHYTHTHTPLLGGYHPKETEVSNGAHICSGLRMELPQELNGKESAYNAEDTGDTGDACSIRGLGRSPVGGNCNPLKYFCQENSTDRGVWRPTVHGVAKSWTRLSN
ncbi:unnamed protein product [Rangifer tarandus platyrhynchus]|uniref:Uncharacterized protein n=2 Tax=Rangifer tarandus platyrhynchus TaxID=3082113 RepID=A0ABN8YK25_RANTA|nr:unnamed protein product [Rangifer tarandus platyrhynchus]